MRRTAYLLVAILIGSGIGLAAPPASAGHGSSSGSKHEGVPPGLAKKGGMPPGLAKKFGPVVPAQAYVAIDPRYDDRAWFLIDGRWVLQQGFDHDVRLEVHSLMAMPPIPGPPPVPLPSVSVGFHVVLFK